MFKWFFTRFKRPKPVLNVKALEEQLQKQTWLRGADLQIFQPLREPSAGEIRCLQALHEETAAGRGTSELEHQLQGSIETSRPPHCGLRVHSDGRVRFEARYESCRGEYVVTIPSRERRDSLQFADGSVGTEWGPEDGSNIQRCVELDAEGKPLSLTGADLDVSTCEAAIWSNSRIVGWTVVHEPKTSYPGAFPIMSEGLAQYLWGVSGVEGVVSHE